SHRRASWKDAGTSAAGVGGPAGHSLTDDAEIRRSRPGKPRHLRPAARRIGRNQSHSDQAETECSSENRGPRFHRTRELSMEDEQIRAALDAHWLASASGDANAEHDIYEDNAICDCPQSGERILGRKSLQALRSHHPGKPSGFNIRRIVGNGNLWVTEY